mmetsp:Transcript_18414/g.52841  ORF Transcript_18414/g.52841 Transcript_18414/m.52841 type:complete len:624 (-) Transcript_18414:216-2087(-)
MTVALPQQLQKAVGELDATCQAKLAELYGKIQFSEDQLETFQLNGGEMTVDLVPTFQAYLQKEIEKNSTAASRTPGKSKINQSTLPFMKRPKTTPSASLPSGVGAALGIAPKPAEAVTPDPKRLKDARGDALLSEPVTPEMHKKRWQISVKSSVNDTIAIAKGPAAAEAGAALTERVAVQVLGDKALWTGPRQGAYAWMDESLEDQAAYREARVTEAEADLLEAVRARHPELEAVVLGRIGLPAQAEVVLVGRIVCEGLEGRLNDRSMLLEGSGGNGRQARVQLNVTSCPTLAAFPGQVVAVLGRSGTANSTFHARDFVPGLPVPVPPPLAAPGCTRLLHTLVLAGPFCRRDGLDYSPLEDALEHAARSGPQVVFILGPFVDSGNLGVVAGEPVLPGRQAGDICSLEEVYTEHVLPLLRQGLASIKSASPSTEVFILPSLDEVLSFHPLPQPPLNLSLGPVLGQKGAEQLRRLGAQFLPNPSHLSIEGLRVTVTSADALSPLMRSGLVVRPEERRIERALRLLLEQRRLFPVFPRDPAMVSEARAAALDFPDGDVPEILIFPSATGTASGQFVDGRLVVNPGSVCRPAAMGSFAEVWLTPPPADGSGGALLQRARVDIKTFKD